MATVSGKEEIWDAHGSLVEPRVQVEKHQSIPLSNDFRRQAETAVPNQVSTSRLSER